MVDIVSNLCFTPLHKPGNYIHIYAWQTGPQCNS